MAMASCTTKAFASLRLEPYSSSFPRSFLYTSSSLSLGFSSLATHFSPTKLAIAPSYLNSRVLKNVKRRKNHICRAAEYKFPDPIPEFADAETKKFKSHLHQRLIKKELCGDSVDEVVGICTEIFSTFLHTEYGGPGTLLVIPFIDMADTINEQGFPGGPQAARIAVKWAQDHVDKDWKEWNGDSN